MVLEVAVSTGYKLYRRHTEPGEYAVVAVEQGNLLGTSFHPEITGEHRFHEYFLSMVRARTLAA